MILHKALFIVGLLILPTTQKLLAINTAKSFINTNPFTQTADDTLGILHAHQILESKLDSIVINYDMMGGILALGCQESEPEFFPLGVSDYMSQDPITPQTPFRIASISKMITALGVMKLVQEDAINLDAPLEVYFGYPIRNPNYPDEHITTRQLLSHQSSIRDGEVYNRFLSVSYSSAEPPSLRSLLTPDGAYYSEELFGSEAPGNWFQYSNLNYGILGTLVEAVSNQAFDVFIKEHVFLPLGIQAGFSSYTRSYDQWPATLYRKPGGQWTVQADGRPSEGSPLDGEKYPAQRDNVLIGSNAIPYGPQGSLRISAEDLMRILLAMQQALTTGYSPENWLHTQTIKEMVGTQWSADTDQGDDYHGLFRAWGLGVHTLTATEGNDVLLSSSERMFGHSGLAYGLVSSAYFDPQQEIRITFITNGIGMPFTEDDRSSFYSVEKDVFEAAESYLKTMSCFR